MKYKIGQVLKHNYKTHKLNILFIYKDYIFYESDDCLYVGTLRFIDIESSGWYPVEEVKEIEKIEPTPVQTPNGIQNILSQEETKINQLIDAVNELRRKE